MNIYGRGCRSPADHSILLLGSLGGLVTLIAVAIAAALTGRAPSWAALVPAGAAVLAAITFRSWRLVRRHGYFHRADDADEDEDEDPEGGSSVRFPPDPSDGGGSPEFDWELFLWEFWSYVDDARQHRQRETVSANSGPAGG